jgi:hypothetical protein
LSWRVVFAARLVVLGEAIILSSVAPISSGEVEVDEQPTDITSNKEISPVVANILSILVF